MSPSFISKRPPLYNPHSPPAQHFTDLGFCCRRRASSSPPQRWYLPFFLFFHGVRPIPLGFQRFADAVSRLVAAVPQDLPDQAEAGEEAAPEPPHPLLDPHEDRQHHQVMAASAPPPLLVVRVRLRVFRLLTSPFVLSCVSGTTRSAGTGAAPSSGSKLGEIPAGCSVGKPWCQRYLHFFFMDVSAFYPS